jgi:hypothetical protein
MPVTLQDDQRLIRKIKVYGIVSPVNVIITANGIEFKVAGAKLGVTQTWPQIVTACNTPESALSYLAGDAVKYLQHAEAQMVKNKIKKLDKESGK